MAKIKLVVFDMDGTLLEPRSCWAYIHEHFGTDNSEMLEKYIKHKINDQEFVKSDISLWKEKSDKKVNEQYINSILDEIIPIDGAEELVKQNLTDLMKVLSTPNEMRFHADWDEIILTKFKIDRMVIEDRAYQKLNMDVDGIRKKFRTPAVDIVKDDEAFTKIKNLFKYVNYKNG